MPVAYSDLHKSANDLLSKDFFHQSTASVEVKTTAPNNVNFTTKGKTLKDSINTSINAKYFDKLTGLTLTQGWNNLNLLSTKIELSDLLTPGLKSELITSIIPNGNKSAKLNFFYQQNSINTRLFFDLLKSPNAIADIVATHDGFIAGAELGYDISSAKVNKYSIGVGYSTFNYTIAATSTLNLSIFHAAYYHKVSPFVEVGAKTTWDSVKSNTVNIEFATKYILDSSAFVKAKIADSGLTAVSYSQQLRKGVTLGLGASFDALKLAEPVHKLGVSLTFNA